MKKYTKADLNYEVDNQEELQDILDFLNDDRIPDNEIKFDLLKASPDELIKRDLAQIAENARYATAW
jgi:pyruvate-formate lyase-activating enzyme